MKRYKLIDTKRNKVTQYSEVQWNFAWGTVYVLGMLVGI
jgi:hypothetical protein